MFPINSWDIKLQVSEKNNNKDTNSSYYDSNVQIICLPLVVLFCRHRPLKMANFEMNVTIPDRQTDIFHEVVLAHANQLHPRTEDIFSWPKRPEKY